MTMKNMALIGFLASMGGFDEGPDGPIIVSGDEEIERVRVLLPGAPAAPVLHATQPRRYGSVKPHIWPEVAIKAEKKRQRKNEKRLREMGKKP